MSLGQAILIPGFGGGLFNFKREVTVESTGTELTDFQVKVSLSSANFDFSNANSDGSDIRFFANSNGTTALSYWIRSYDDSGETAEIWVKVPTVPASGDTSIWMFYGSPGLTTSTSEIQDTFVAGDDWSAFNKQFEFAAQDVCHDTCKIGSTIYASGRANDTDLVLHKTTDEGATWTEELSVVWASVSNGHLSIDTDGGTNIYAVTERPNNALAFKKSTDSGATWGSEVSIVTGLNNAADPKILYVSSSLLLAFIKEDVSGSTDRILCYSSGNDGDTWLSLSTVVSEAATSGIEDLDAIVDADGNIRVCWENETTDLGASSLKEAVSDDNGETWVAAATIVAESGSIDNEGPHYMLDSSGNLSVIYPTTAGTSEAAYDNNEVYQAAYNGTSWDAPVKIWESRSHVETVGEYCADGSILHLSKRHHGDPLMTAVLTAGKIGANVTDFSDRGWTLDTGTCWVVVDPTDATLNTLRLQAFDTANIDTHLSHSGSSGDLVIEGRFRSAGPTQQNLRVGFAYADKDNYYMLIYSTDLFLYERFESAANLLATASPSPGAAAANTWYAFKVQMSSSSPTTIKVWLDAASDATTLRIDTTDTRYSSGKIAAIQNNPKARIPSYLSELRARKFAATEPTITVGAQTGA